MKPPAGLGQAERTPVPGMVGACRVVQAYLGRAWHTQQLVGTNLLADAGLN